MRFRLTHGAPAKPWHGHGLHPGQRHAHEGVIARATRLEQYHLRGRVFTQPRRERAAGTAGADYDEICLGPTHANPLSILSYAGLSWLPGTAVSAALKPILVWVPSQKGLLVEAPQ